MSRGRALRATVTLRPYSDDDLGLLRRILGDPQMSRHLGGPETEHALAVRHERYLTADPGTNGLSVILVGDDRTPAGWVGFWESEWESEHVWECGWHVLPEFQGQGVATAAAALAIEEARARARHRFLDAFPAEDNVASNALCRRLGFDSLGPVAVEYPKGRMMRAVHWRLDLHCERRGHEPATDAHPGWRTDGQA